MTRRFTLVSETGESIEVKVLSGILVVICDMSKPGRALKCLIRSSGSPAIVDSAAVWVSAESLHALHNLYQHALPDELNPVKGWKMVYVPLPPDLEE